MSAYFQQYLQAVRDELARMDDIIKQMPADNSAADARAHANRSRERLREELRDLEQKLGVK